MVLWPIRARVLFELFYNIELKQTCRVQYCPPILCHPFHWALKNVADLTQFLERQHPWFDILRKRKPRIWHEIYKSPRVPHWHKIVWIVKDNSICLIFGKKSGHLQGRNKVYEIRDHSPGIWDHNTWDRDQQCFSGIRDQNLGQK